MVNVILSFDTEEYETPGSHEGARLWLDLLEKHRLPGSFCVVSEKARLLVADGRRDIVQRLAGHEISSHTDRHCRPPMHAVYLDGMEWEAGVERVVREEAPGVSDLRAIFGRQPASWCKPGASWGPQSCVGFERLGVPVFSDAPFEAEPGWPLWYCGQLLLKYHMSLDGFRGRTDRVSGLARAFEQTRRGIVRDGYLVIYTHPCLLVMRSFPDNFRYGADPPRHKWVPAPLLPADWTRAWVRDLDEWLGWLKTRPGVRFVGYREMLERFREPEMRWLTRGRLAAAAGHAARRLTHYASGRLGLSPAEIFGAVVWALARAEQGRLPARTPVRRPLGPTRTPPRLSGPVRVSSEEILRRCRTLDRRLSEERALPSSLGLGAARVGPGAFLRAAARLVARLDAGRALPTSMTLRPAPELPDLASRRDIAGLRFKDTWSMFPRDFEGKRIIRAARLQTWTARPALAQRVPPAGQARRRRR